MELKKLTFVGNRSGADGVTEAKLARVPALGMAGAVAVLLLVTSGRYGYFGDELSFLAAGRHLAWGYADQPPVHPLPAHLEVLFVGDDPGILAGRFTSVTPAGRIDDGPASGQGTALWPELRDFGPGTG
ncbi:hypothetical protein [Amycolatopsis thermophila]|uniref:Uncharacterized protein n=1 Tax=Amycolatopsis thermophila TaxID=206084 RepID=A0ABU0F5C4_9PSEU|nr:hypothetical protein [Amycolatopsis thermophila]